MKRTLLLAFILVFCLSASVFAAPLNDYSKPGNFSLGLWWQRSEMKDDLENLTNPFAASYNFDSKWNVFGEATIVVAPKLALSLDYGSYQSGQVQFPVDATIKLNSLNFKVKYEAYNKDRLFLAPYLGLARNKMNLTQRGITAKSNTKNSFLLGLTTVYGLDKDERLKAYLDLGFGNKARGWNLGMSYQVAKNLDFDLGYKWYKAKDMTYVSEFGDIINCDITSKGVYLGMTYRFN